MADEHIPLPQNLVNLFASNRLTIYVRLVTKENEGRPRSRFLATVAPISDASSGQPVFRQNTSLRNALLECLDDIQTFILPRWLSPEDCQKATSIICEMEDRQAEPPPKKAT